MKDNIIESKVHKLQNLSERVKEFIQQKSNTNYTPFYQQPQIISNHQNKRKPKRSLTDWRQLFQKKNNKIEPKNIFSPSTMDGFRIRHAMTAQQKRSKDQFQSRKPQSTAWNRFKQTRQSKRMRLNQSKRQSIIQFAFAQTHYQNKIMKNNQQKQTLKEKQFLQNPKYNAQRQNYLKIGQYLQVINRKITQQSNQQNLTDKYLNNMKLTGNIRLSNYNTAKIKDKSKINNSRFMQNKGLHQKRMLLKGLRYYSRG